MSKLIGLLFITLYAVQTMGIEEPKYQIEVETKNYQIRTYDSVLVAETLVEAEFSGAGNKAFRILADYIFGNNVTQEKMEMTAPVAMERSEKMAMTAPVNLSEAGQGQYLVQFMIPSKYTMETVPRPKDPRVTLRELPRRRVAVFRYSGSWSQKRYQTKLSEFLNHLEVDGLEPMGEPTLARFNSPFSLWFLRRNEIWLELPLESHQDTSGSVDEQNETSGTH